MADKVTRTPAIMDAIETLLKDIGDTTTTREQISNVLDALDSLQRGEPVGTVRIDDASGKVAVRVKGVGVAQWKVVSADGGQYNDLSDRLPWRCLHTPDKTVEAVPADTLEP